MVKGCNCPENDNDDHESDNHGMEASDSNSAGDNRKKKLIHVEEVIGKKSLHMLPKKRP